MLVDSDRNSWSDQSNKPMTRQAKKTRTPRKRDEIRPCMSQPGRTTAGNEFAKELLKMEERYRNLVELSPDMMALHHRGKFVYVNPAGVRLLGASEAGDLIGKSHLAFIHPDFIGMVKERIRDLEQGKPLPLTEERYVRLDGKVVDVEVAAAAIPFQEGLMVQVIARDITERKAAEDELRQEKDKAQKYLDAAGAILLVIDASQRVSLINKKGCEVLGTSEGEILGANWFDTFLPEKERDGVKTLFGELMAGEAGPTEYFENHVVTKAGHEKTIAWRNTLLHDETGKILGTLSSGEDITEGKKAEEALRKSEEEAQRLAHENSVLARIGRIVSSTLSIEEVYKLFSEEVRKLLPFDRIGVSLIDKGKRLIFNRYIEGLAVPSRGQGDVFPLENTFSEAVIKSRKGMIIVDDREEAVLAKYPGLLPSVQAGVRSFLSVPLIAGDEVIGVIHFRSMRAKAYAPRDVKLAESIAHQIAGAISSARLYQQRMRAEEAARNSEKEAKRLAQESALIAEIGRIIGSKLNIDEVFERFTKAVAKLIPFDRIVINLHSDEKKTSFVRYAAGMDVPHRRVGEHVPLEGSASEECMRKKSSLLVQPDDIAEASARFPGLVPTFQAGIRSIIMVPLISEDKIIGVLTLRSLKEKAYTEQDVRLAESISSQIAGAIANARLFDDLQQAEETLRGSEEKYRLVVQNANDAIFIVQDGVIKFANTKTEELAGYSGAELLNYPFATHIHPEDRDLVLEKHRKRLQGKASPEIYSFRIRNKSGEELWVELNSVLITWEGKPATLNFLRNITEHKKLETQFLQAQKMEAVGRLAGGIAHDFNNLLTIINTYTQLALMDLKEWDPLKEKLDSIQRAGERAANLTKRLLAFSRREVAEQKNIDLNTLLQDLEKMLHRVIGEDIELNTILEKTPTWVKVSPGYMEQAILNLVINAKDAMPSGGKLTIETAKVEVSKDYSHSHFDLKPGPYVMLSVSDTGVGMTPEIRERIFEPFFTTKAKDKGTGLGLSTVYGVVKQSEGNIWVYSEPGRGTTFKIYLPRIDAREGELEKKIERDTLAGGKETILVVEDEEEVRKLAAAILRKRGYRVLEAAQGGDAFLICEQRKEDIHLLMTDVVMPGLNGPELARRLMYFCPEMKVLFMSGYTDNAILQQGVLDRNMFFLQKPFSVEGLIGKVRETLDH